MTSEATRIWLHSKDTNIDGQLYAEISVENEGSFVPSEERKNLFTRFYTKGKARGSGLGLAISSDIVTSHGGSIRCESDEEKGTEFIFTLPLTQET